MSVRYRPGQQLSFFTDWTAAATDQASAPDASARRDESAPARKPSPSRHKQAALRIALVAAGVAACAALPATSASADPSANSWYRLRVCESSNNYSTNTGNNHYGAYQFDLSTWRSVGGTGYPNRASAAEQDARALILYRERGWQPWQCASILGLREDRDARSGRISDIHIGKSAVAPPFPGPYFHYGDHSPTIKRFQDQMHARGFFPVGTGDYGPNTQQMVKRLQSQNGLIPNGEIGPNTWRLAWTGAYHL